MGTLTINGRSVTVDNSFANLSSADQEKTVNEIASQMGGQAQPQQPAAAPQQAPVAQQSQPDFGTQMMNATGATVNGLVNGIPVVGPLAQGATDILGGGIAQLTGGNFNDYIKRQQALRKGYADAAPLASLSGNVGGALASLGGLGAIPAGAEAMGLTGAKTIPRMVNGLLSTEAIGTADNMARGQKPTDAMMGAVLPAMAGGIGGPLIGKGIEALGGKIASSLTNAVQNRLTSAAIGAGTTADALKAESSNMFHAVDQSGVTVDTNKFSSFVQNLISVAKKDRINSTLDPKSHAAYQELISALGDVQSSGGALAISDIHTLRQIAQKAAMSSDGRDAMFANRIVDGLDTFVTTPGNLVLPPNQLGQGTNDAGNELMKAISTWGRAKRTGVVEEAIYKAQNQASGLENGLRTQFRSIIMNPKKRAMFSSAEIQAFQTVANGTPMSNAMKLLGKFGFAPNNWLGGMGGLITGNAVGGLPGAVAVGIAGRLARNASQAMTEKAANRAAQVVATPNIPIARQIPNMLAPARKPIELLIRGGAQALSP